MSRRGRPSNEDTASKKFLRIREPVRGRTSRHNDYKNLQTVEIMENEGDGDCLFLSLMQHLKHDNYRPLPASVFEIRTAIIDYVIEHWMDYGYGLLNYDPKFQKKFDRRECPQFEQIEKCQKMYRKYMSTTEPATWGTAVELAAASKLYNFQCTLLTIDEDHDDILTISKINGLDEQTRGMRSRRICLMMFSGDLLEGHFRYLMPTVPTEAIYTVPNGTYEMDTTGNVTTVTLMQMGPNATTYARYES